MSTRISLAACAALLFGVFQGCDSSASLATSGDRSAEGNGSIGFRLSETSVSILNQSSYLLQYRVFGPGMDTIQGSDYPKVDPILIQNVPAGTRIVEVAAINWDGLPTWLGRDTVEVNAGTYTNAKIIMTRQAPRYGNLILDLSIDTTIIPDSLDPRDPIDTVWQSLRHPTTGYEYGYKYCNPPTWKGESGDSLLVNCFDVKFARIPGDTIWQDTVVHHPVSDTSFWCTLEDQWKGSANVTDSTGITYRCYRPRYEASIDTLWQDTISRNPVDSTPICAPSTSSEYATVCSRMVYRPSFSEPMCYRDAWESAHSLHYYICLSDSSQFDSQLFTRKKPR